jgi:hypothetical protein
MTNNTNSSGFDIGLLGGNLDATAYIYQRANASLAIGTNNSTKVTILSDGNVGIGTANPSSTLHVSGTGIFSGTTDQILTLNATDSSWSYIGYSWAGSRRFYTGLDNSGNYTFGSDTGAAFYFTGANVGIGITSPNALLDVAGGINSRNTRIDATRKYPIGHYSSGDTVFEIDPTWTQAQLQDYFGSTAFTWNTDSTAPGGYTIQIDGAVNVGNSSYSSGFPYIPVDTGSNDWYYMECWIKNEAGSLIRHYMGSIDYNATFGVLTGNPGTFTYNVMSNYDPGTTWTKVFGYWNSTGTLSGGSGTGNTNNWPNNTKYFGPLALFNYDTISGTSRCYISGWRLIKASNSGNKVFNDGLTSSGGTLGTTSGDRKILQTFTTKTANTDNLEITNIRIGNGADWFTAGHRIQQKVDGFWMGYIQFNGGNNSGISIGTGLSNVSPTSVSERFRITDGGNVGIGATSPSARLEIKSSAANNLGGLLLRATTTSDFPALLYENSTNGGTLDLYNAASLTTRISSNGNSYFNSGSVGIGTNSPATKLDVQGDGVKLRLSTATDPSTYNFEIESRYDSGNTVNFYGAAGTNLIRWIYNTNNLILQPSNGSVSISNLSGTGDRIVGTDSVGTLSSITVGSGLSLSGGTLTATGGSAGTVTGTGASTQVSYWTSTSNVTGSNGFIYDNSISSVGINETSPSGKLTISNNGGGSDVIFQKWRYATGGNSYYLDLKQTVTSGVVRYNFSMVNNDTPYNDVLVLDRGNVGVGTTDPTFKLDVLSNGSAIRAMSNTSYVDLAFTNTSTTSYIQASGTAMYFYVAGGSSSDVVLSLDGTNNRVGIGTLTPLDSLDVYKANNGTWAPRILARDETVASFIGAYNSKPGVFAHNSALNAWAELYVNTVDGTSTNGSNVIMGGNLGIGTGVTSPVSQLHLGNNVSAGGFTSFGNYQILLYKSGTVASSYGIGIESSTMMFNSDEFYKFYVDNTAKVLINSSGTLTAAGDLVAYGSPSDINLKTNIKPLTGALDKIIKLQGVSFTWKEDTEINKITGIKDDIGFIAQEVKEILPELVRENKNGLLSLRDKGITALLVEAIKEQQKQIDELKYLLQNK